MHIQTYALSHSHTDKSEQLSVFTTDNQNVRAVHTELYHEEAAGKAIQSTICD